MLNEKIIINKLSASRGLAWVKSSWEEILKKPWYWVAFGAIFLVVFSSSAFIDSFFYSAVLSFVSFFIVPSVYKLIENIVKSENYFNFDSLLFVLKEKLSVFLFYYLIMFGMFVIPTFLVFFILILFFSIGYPEIVSSLQEIDSLSSLKNEITDLLLNDRFIVILSFVGFFCVLLAFLFGGLFFLSSIILLLFDITPWQSLKLSAIGVLKNVLPFFVYSFIWLLLSLVIMITLGLASIVAMPLFYLSLYFCVTDIYTENQLSKQIY